MRRSKEPRRRILLMPTVTTMPSRHTLPGMSTRGNYRRKKSRRGGQDHLQTCLAFPGKTRSVEYYLIIATNVMLSTRVASRLVSGVHTFAVTVFCFIRAGWQTLTQVGVYMMVG